MKYYDIPINTQIRERIYFVLHFHSCIFHVQKKKKKPYEYSTREYIYIPYISLVKKICESKLEYIAASMREILRALYKYKWKIKINWCHTNDISIPQFYRCRDDKDALTHVAAWSNSSILHGLFYIRRERGIWNEEKRKRCTGGMNHSRGISQPFVFFYLFFFLYPLTSTLSYILDYIFRMLFYPSSKSEVILNSIERGRGLIVTMRSSELFAHNIATPTMLTGLTLSLLSNSWVSSQLLFYYIILFIFFFFFYIYFF